MTLLLSDDDVRATVSMAEAVAELEDAYRQLAAGHGTQRPRSDSFAATARPGTLFKLSSTDAIAPGLGVAAIRVSTGFYAWTEGPSGGRREKDVDTGAARPTPTGLVLLFSTATGELLAVLRDDALSVLRLGATNAIAASYLAARDASVVALLGCGRQAGGLLEGLATVSRLERVRCFSPTAARREAFAQRWSAALGIEVEPVASAREAVRGASIVQCATNSTAGVLSGDWIEPGMHVASIRAHELDAGALRRIGRLVVFVHDAVAQAHAADGVPIPERDAARGWREAGVDLAALPQLTDLVAGRAGRAAPDEVTGFLNTIGSAYQFAVLGAIAHRRAAQAGRGRELATAWFSETAD